MEASSSRASGSTYFLALSLRYVTASSAPKARIAAAEEEARRLREQVEAASRAQQESKARHEKFVEQLAAARNALAQPQAID